MYTISGISPNDIPETDIDLEKQLINLHDFIEKNLKTNNKIVAIGEIGLDYYWEKDEERRKLQQIAFIKQINMANEFELPIVIHTREAVMDTLEILKKHTVLKEEYFIVAH